MSQRLEEGDADTKVFLNFKARRKQAPVTKVTNDPNFSSCRNPASVAICA